jgi:hydroxyacylglutathione hydrolase
MPQEIKTINLGGINCYLVKNRAGYCIIDTGYPAKRTELQRRIEAEGCQPGNLNLIVLTHGDFDHAGNAGYLRERYSAQIAMHPDDSGIVEHGDMNWNRKAKSDKTSIFFRIIILMTFFVRTGRFDTFMPDLAIDEGFSLCEYGFDANVIHLPGHSKGSIGILTDDGDLFCGDLVYNFFGKPGFVYFINDLADYGSSIEKLRRLDIRTVYPGHGKPFPIELFMKRGGKQ